jgi:hypothetical protein
MDEIRNRLSENVIEISPKGTNNSMWYILIGIFIIALLGLNLFYFLGRATDETVGFLKPIIDWLAKTFGIVFGQTVDVVEEGTKAGVDVTAGVLKSGVDVTKDVTIDTVDLGADVARSSANVVTGTISSTGNMVRHPETSYSTNVQRTTHAPIYDIQEQNGRENEARYTPQQKHTQSVKNEHARRGIYSENDMPVQGTNAPNKHHGWCYIGTDRGIRSCARVENQMECMSGPLFPTLDVCVNPELRY